ncbi:MAG TPA: hypothetical protein VF053_06795 [Streptosporangiales bacterium]
MAVTLGALAMCMVGVTGCGGSGPDGTVAATHAATVTVTATESVTTTVTVRAKRHRHPATSPATHAPQPTATHHHRKRPTPTRTRTRTSAPVQRGVHPGAFCSPHGALGYTDKGTLMRCSTKSGDTGPNGPYWRWRSAG